MGPITSNDDDDVRWRVPPRESQVGKLWYRVGNTYGTSSRAGAYLNRIQCSGLACLSLS